jgi:hypothetical protein
MRWFGFGSAPVGADVLSPSRRARIASPWSPGMSASIMAADWLGASADLIPATREQAMRVPAIVAARNILCTELAQGALRQYRGDALTTAQPSWLSRTDGDLAPQLRTLWTFDDLLFSGFSLWRAIRNGRGELLDAWRIPPELWTFDADWRLMVDDRPANADQVILFTGWDEGLLTTGADVIRQSLAISSTVTSRVRNPVPVVLLEEQLEQGRTDGTEDPEDDEVGELLDTFTKARRSQDGATAYVPYGIKVNPFGKDETDLLEQGRNAAALDVARLTGIPAAALEATGTSASLTYSTSETTRAIKNDRLRARAAIFEARLSMDDVTPRGTRVALDLSHLVGPETGLPASTED